MSNILPCVKSYMFVGIIRNKYVDRCFSLDLVNAINDVDVWVSSLCSVVICDEICHLFFNNWSTNSNWYNTIVSWQYIECRFNCANGCLLFAVSCICQEFSFLLNVTVHFLIPSISNREFLYIYAKGVLYLVTGCRL